MSDERFEVFAWRDGDEQGETKGVFVTEAEAATFREGLVALSRRLKPNFIKVVHQPSGQTLSYTSDHWGGGDEDPPAEPDLTFKGYPEGLRIKGGMPPFRSRA